MLRSQAVQHFEGITDDGAVELVDQLGCYVQTELDSPDAKKTDANVDPIKLYELLVPVCAEASLETDGGSGRLR